MQQHSLVYPTHIVIPDLLQSIHNIKNKFTDLLCMFYLYYTIYKIHIKLKRKTLYVLSVAWLKKSINKI